MDGLELLTSVFLDDLARNPTATREENPAGPAPDSDAPPGPGTRPMSPPSTQPAWTASAPPFLGAPAFRARQSLSHQGQDRRCLLVPLSTPAYSSASTPAVRWRATSFAQPYMWASLRKHLPFPHPQPGAAGVSLITTTTTTTTSVASRYRWILIIRMGFGFASDGPIIYRNKAAPAVLTWTTSICVCKRMEMDRISRKSVFMFPSSLHLLGWK